MDYDDVLEQVKPNATKDHPHSYHAPSLVMIMTSSVFTVVCVGVIIILAFILGGLIFFYCTRIRNYYRYGTTMTWRYPPAPTEKKKRKKTKGLGYDNAHRHTPIKTPGQWPSVPVSPHMDIAAGHLLLSYIEANLQDVTKLNQEWELGTREGMETENLQKDYPEATSTKVANLPMNKTKNRYQDALPYDHTRVKLSPENSATGSDYINASYIIDADPMHPKYIATQGPLQNTVPDFWQMVWEQHVSVIVMLTQLIDMGLSQSCQYWPSGGMATYGIYEVRLVSEHPHSEHYIIRSFTLLNTQSKESRTVTQFHYLTWDSLDTPSPPTPLLEFRRKVNKAHARPDTPLLVHCNGGVGRTGTYILIDMALSRIQSGVKEMNLVATVEHLRDHRPHMVMTKAQFEFALRALVEETNAMMDAARRLQ